MRRHSQSGSVALVALCFAAVLGIGLAGYLAVSTQSMRLSHRAYAKDTSRHLAEMGLEQALQAFNSGSFTGWTISGTTATRALTTSSSPALPLFGNSGITPTVNLRVDRYSSTVWSPATAYAVNAMVWYHGVWFHCKTPHTNRVPPDTNYWISAPAPWSPDAYYSYNATSADIVLYGGSAYSCITSHNNQAPGGSNWSTSHSVSNWNSSTTYAVDDIALLGGTAYRCISSHTNQSPPNLTYWISAPTIYSEGLVVLNDSSSPTVKTQLLASLAPASLFPNAAAATALVNLTSGGTVDSYNSVVGSYGGSNVGFSAVLAGGNTSAWAVSINTATIKGYVAAPSASTSPYDPWAQFGTNTTVNLKNSDGTITSARSGSANVDNTRITRSPYIPQFDIQSVTAGNLPNGTTYMPDNGYSLGSMPVAGIASPPLVYNITRSYTGASYYSGLYLADAADVLTINGPVILNVSGSYFGTGLGKILVNPGGSLEVYCSSGTELYLGLGAGGIDNQTGDPSKVLIVSSSTNNLVNYHYLFNSGSTLPFCGTIYMPGAFLTISNNVAAYGAISASNIRFVSNANLHYDTALRTASRSATYTAFGGLDAPYMISQWRELTSPSERVTLP